MIDRYRDLDDPDELVLRVCHMLFCGEKRKPRFGLRLSVRHRNEKFEAVIDLTFFDVKAKETYTRRVEAGEGRSVAKARKDLLDKLVARAQAVIDLPVTQVMES